MADLQLSPIRKSFASPTGALTILHGIDLAIRDGEFIVECRRRETLAPDLMLEHARCFKREMLDRQSAVGFNHAFEVSWRQQRLRHCFKRCTEAAECSFTQRETSSGGMPAKFQNKIGFALGDKIERVAQVERSD